MRRMELRASLPRVAAVIAVAVVTAACSGTSSAERQREAPDTAPPRGTTSTQSAAEAPPDGSNLHGVRYCEILTVTFAPEGGATAEVWNTMGLNDCPQVAWEAVDLDTVKTETGAPFAATNGPRYWVLDRIVPGKLATSLEVKSLSGLEMRSVAVVELPSITPSSVSNTPYTETSVRRDTVFTFAAGRRIYELTAPDGSIYVMQSYSQQLDADLAVADLADLRARLDLPTGWSFQSRVLRTDLEVEDLDGIATVVQDDLRNTYQLRSRG